MATKKKTAKKRKPLPDAKALTAAKKRLDAAKKKASAIQKQIAEQQKIVSESPVNGKAYNVANQSIRRLTIELGDAQKGVSTATTNLVSATKNRASALRAAGYEGQAKTLMDQSASLEEKAKALASDAASNKYKEGAQTNQDTLMGGALGLANTVTDALPAAAAAGQGLVGMNLGEANTALMGGGGQTGLLGLLDAASKQGGLNTAASQAQQIAGIGSMSGDVRTALQKLSPEAAAATKSFTDNLARDQRLADRTTEATRRGLDLQGRLSTRAMNQALSYQDKTTPKVNRAGNLMMHAAGSTARLANQATDQAMNYVDPTADLAAGAISGYQGLAGLQQGAAEDAYSRAQRLNPEQMRDADQAARESFGARGMLGSTGSVASEVLNRESSLAARRAEAAGLGQLAQAGQSGLVGLASGYESDTLDRRTGLQQNAAGLQGLAGGQFGAAGGFISAAESARLARRQGEQGSAMDLMKGALASNAAMRGESNAAAGNLFGAGKFFTDLGLPLMTQGAPGQALGLGLLGTGLGMGGQGSGLIEAGSNVGMARWTTEQEREAALRAAKANEKAGLFQGIGSALGGAAGAIGAAGGAAAFFSDIRLKKNLRHIGDIGKLNAFEWDWNDLAPEPTQETVGFIAQQVMEHYPQFVHEVNGYFAIDYAGLMKHIKSDMTTLRSMADTNNKGKD